MAAGIGVCPACYTENSLVVKPGTDSTWLCIGCGWNNAAEVKKLKVKKRPKRKRSV